MTTPMTPRAVRINIPRAFARGLLEDVEQWKPLHASDVRLSGGVLTSHSVTLYLQASEIPPALIALCVRAARAACGSAALCGAWMINMEPARQLDAAALLEAL